MTTNILIVESNPPDLVQAGLRGAAGFEKSLARLAPRANLSVVAPYQQGVTEADLEGIDAVVFSGTSAHVGWGVADSAAKPLRSALELCFTSDLPVWGSCNGMRLGALVLGGEVGPSPNGIELGVARDIQITEMGQSHPMMRGRKSGYGAPCVHFHEVRRLGAGTLCLAGNAHSPVQAIAHCEGEDFWGAQYHPELVLADIAAMTVGTPYEEAQETMANLRIGDENTAAAQALGASPDMLGDRLLELRNWLVHVEERK